MSAFELSGLGGSTGYVLDRVFLACSFRRRFGTSGSAWRASEGDHVAAEIRPGSGKCGENVNNNNNKGHEQ